ncbi:hypothetical protein Taro_044662, partial [Colocasia esculenta]|nr:hypothetical protein [Colocasia esculenta]
CVDTSTGGVDTRSVFQKTFWVNWDSVSTLAQVVSTLEAFPEHHLGGFGTVCRHWLKYSVDTSGPSRTKHMVRCNQKTRIMQ